MCIYMIYNWFKMKKYPKPDDKGNITGDELRTIIIKEMGNIPILIPDKWFKLTTLESFQEFLEVDTTDKYSYTGDSKDSHYDCDDYAERLHGNANVPKWSAVPIGVCWLKEPAHAVNIFIDDELTLWYVEPQNDEMYKVSEKTDWVPMIVWL
jgi:hypothetical protein